MPGAKINGVKNFIKCIRKIVIIELLALN